MPGATVQMFDPAKGPSQFGGGGGQHLSDEVVRTRLVALEKLFDRLDNDPFSPEFIAAVEEQVRQRRNPINCR